MKSLVPMGLIIKSVAEGLNPKGETSEAASGVLMLVRQIHRSLTAINIRRGGALSSLKLLAFLAG